MSFTKDAQETVAVIVAGGRARRMGGGDKTLRLLAGRPMVSYVWTIIAPQVKQVALNINGPPERFATILPDTPVLADAETDQGPLAGVLAGLHWAAQIDAACLLTVPGDTPFLPHDLVIRLTRAIAAGRAQAACACSIGRLHPLIGVWHVALTAPLAAFLASGNRTVEQFLNLCRPVVVDFVANPLDPFMNVNTLADLMAAERMTRE